MSIFRLILFVRTPLAFSFLAPKSEIFNCFIVGLRFDILVVCFMLLPLLGVSYFFALGLWNSLFLLATRFYLLMMWMLISVLSMVDGVAFIKNHHRTRYGSFQVLFDINWFSAINSSVKMNSMVSFLSFIVFLLGLGTLFYEGFRPWQVGIEKISRLQIFVRLLIPLSFIILGARGSVGPHHLEYQDSQISTLSTLNELSLNSLWAFDK